MFKKIVKVLLVTVVLFGAVVPTVVRASVDESQDIEIDPEDYEVKT
jgi:hypothetical protein